MSYPDTPGFKVPGPSKDAAHAMRGPAKELRKRIVGFLRSRFPKGFTADEITAQFEMSVYPIRPRLSEAHYAGEVEQTGERRLSQCGRPVNLWRAVMVGRDG